MGCWSVQPKRLSGASKERSISCGSPPQIIWNKMVNKLVLLSLRLHLE